MAHKHARFSHKWSGWYKMPIEPDKSNLRSYILVHNSDEKIERGEWPEYPRTSEQAQSKTVLVHALLSMHISTKSFIQLQCIK